MDICFKQSLLQLVSILRNTKGCVSGKTLSIGVLETVHKFSDLRVPECHLQHHFIEALCLLHSSPLVM